MTDKRNAVIQHGFDDKDTPPPEWLADEITLSFGPDSKSVKWHQSTMTIGEFIKLNSEHTVGKKDGRSFLQGKLSKDRGANRYKKSMTQLDILALDIDHGAPIADMIEAIEDKGLFALLYTSHSHNKDVTRILVDKLHKDTGKPADHKFTNDEMCDYLTHNRGYDASVLADGVTFEVLHEEGVFYVIKHNPMPRYRVVFVLTEPFLPAGMMADGISPDEGMRVWARKYAGVAQMLETYFDTSCTDLSRLYYMPRHVKGADHEVHLINGDTLDLMTIKDGDPRGYVKKLGKNASVVDRMEAMDRAENTGGGKAVLTNDWLMGFIVQHPNFHFYDFFMSYYEDEKRGQHDTGDKGSFKCPNDDQHTEAGNPDDVGFYATNPGGDGQASSDFGTAWCKHNSCGENFDRLASVDAIMVMNGLDDPKDLYEFCPDAEGNETIGDLAKYADSLDDDDEDIYGIFTDDIKALGLKKKDFENMDDELQDFVTNISIMNPTSDDALVEMLTDLVKRKDSTTMEQSRLKLIGIRGGFNMITLKKQFRILKQQYWEKNESAKDKKKNKEYPDKTLKRLKQMNKQMATILRGSTAFVMKDQAYENNPAKEGIKYINMTSATTLKRNEKTQARDQHSGELTQKNAFDVWMDWPERRDYEGIAFDPSVSGHIKNEFGDIKYNLWNDWAFEPSRKGSCDILLDHIKNNLCHGIDEWYNFFMAYFSHLIQFPEQIPGVAVVIQGEKGCGKSIVLEEILVNNMISPYGMTTATIKELFGNFNARVENKLLIVMTEAFWGGDKAVEGMLKDAITGSNMVLKLKGIDDADLPNYRRFACTANDGFVVPATHDERRFFVLKCKSKRVGDTDYFQAMMDQMEDGGYEKFMHILSTWKEPEGGWKGYFFKPPVTPWLQEQISENKASWEKWIDNLIYEGEALAPTNGDLTDIRLSDTEPTFVKQTEMNAWWRHNTRNAQHQSPAKKCTAYMRQTFPDILVENHRSTATQPCAVACYKFPPRNELRVSYPEIFRETHDETVNQE